MQIGGSKFIIFAYNHQQLTQADRDRNSNNISQFVGLQNDRLYAKVVDEQTLSEEIAALLANEKQVVLSS